jgi:hypothetical protein
LTVDCFLNSVASVKAAVNSQLSAIGEKSLFAES